jgi:hypothetical protein
MYYVACELYLQVLLQICLLTERFWILDLSRFKNPGENRGLERNLRTRNLLDLT